jgi:hypothetical protein
MLSLCFCRGLELNYQESCERLISDMCKEMHIRMRAAIEGQTAV